MALPLPPNIGGPNSLHGTGQVAGTGPYTLPYEQPLGGQLVAGINEFLKQYREQRNASKNQAAQEADQDIKNMMLGLPVDIKKTAAKLKKAGVNLDFESDRPGVTPSVPPPPQGKMDRLKQELGFSQPPINPNSPGMEALLQISQRGQTRNTLMDKALGLQGQQLDLSAQQMSNQSRLQSLLTGALNNDPKALELATRFGLAHSLPSDTWFQIGRGAGKSDEEISKQMWWMYTGGPEAKRQLIDLADKNKERFGGRMDQAMKYYDDILSTGKSSIEPEMTFDEQIKVAERADKLMQLHPTMPLNIARLSAEVEVAGNKELADKTRTFIAKNYPTAGAINLQQYSQDFNLQIQKFRESQQQFRLSHELAVVNSVKDALGGQFNKFAEMYNSATKEGDDGNRNAALKGMVDAMQKLGQIEVQLPGGQKINLGTSNLELKRVEGWLKPSTWFNDWGGDPTLQLNFADMLGAGVQNPSAMGNVLNALRQIMDIPLYIKDDSEKKAYRENQIRRLKEILGTGPQQGIGLMP
jgi:hypothetical protein